MIVDNNEFFGVGISIWKDRILFYMGKRLKHIPDLKKLLFKRNVDNMHREYMALIASGYQKADRESGSGDMIKWNRQTYRLAREIEDRTNLPFLFVLYFFSALYNLAAIGKVPFKEWNPKGFTKSTVLKKSLPSQKNIFQNVGISTKLLPFVLVGGIVGGMILSGYAKKLT